VNEWVISSTNVNVLNSTYFAIIQSRGDVKMLKYISAAL